MVALRTITLDEISDPSFEHTSRLAWRNAVDEITAKAMAKLPECSSRIERAVKLVLQGDVTLQADGTAKIAGQSQGAGEYLVVNGCCPCKDFAKAPHGFCKHRLGAAIARRAQELLQGQPPTTSPVEAPPTAEASAQPPAQVEAPSTALPEAPASVNVRLTIGGREVQLTLRDTDEARLLTRLGAILAQYPLPDTTQPTETTPPQGWCVKHQVKMTLNQKEGRSWWSHKTTEGWCKGR